MQKFIISSILILSILSGCNNFSNSKNSSLSNGEYVISSFTQSRFQTDFQIDLTGYIFNTYFDSLGNYQGEYKDCGYVKKYSLIGNLEDIGATILFYGKW